MPVSGSSDVNLRFDSVQKKFVPNHITAEPHTIAEIPGQPGKFGFRLIEAPLRATVDGMDPVTSTVPNPPIIISGYSLVSTAPAADEFFPDFFFEDSPVKTRSSLIYFHESQNGTSVLVEYYGMGAANSVEAISNLVDILVGDISADTVKRNLFINGDMFWWRRYGSTAANAGNLPFGGTDIGPYGKFGPDKYFLRAKDVDARAKRLTTGLPTFVQCGYVPVSALRVEAVDDPVDTNSFMLIEQTIINPERFMNGSLTRTFWIRSNQVSTICCYLMSYNREHAYVKSELIQISTANTWLKRSITFEMTQLSDAVWKEDGLRIGFGISFGNDAPNPTDIGLVSNHYDEEFTPETTASVFPLTEGPATAPYIFANGDHVDFTLDSLIEGDQPLGTFKLQSDGDHETERELCERYFETMYPDSIEPGSDSPSDYDGFVCTIPTSTPDSVAYVFVPFKKTMFDFLPGFPLGEQLDRVKIYSPNGTANNVHSYNGGNVSATVIEVTQFGFTVDVSAAQPDAGLVNFYWTVDKEYQTKEEL